MGGKGGRKGRGQRLLGRGRRYEEYDEEEEEQEQRGQRPHRPFPPAQFRREFAGIQEAFWELYTILVMVLNLLVTNMVDPPRWALDAVQDHPLDSLQGQGDDSQCQRNHSNHHNNQRKQYDKSNHQNNHQCKQYHNNSKQ